jgi:hypothetical protein
VTPYGAVIAAPPPETRELFCRSGLKYYARIPGKNIHAALAEVEKQRTVLRCSKPSTKAAKVLRTELDLAARMAAQSCKIMLWQQALASKKAAVARRLARTGVEGCAFRRDFNAYWPSRSAGRDGQVLILSSVAMNDFRAACYSAGNSSRRAAKSRLFGIAPRTQLVLGAIR